MDGSIIKFGAASKSVRGTLAMNEIALKPMLFTTPIILLPNSLPVAEPRQNLHMKAIKAAVVPAAKHPSLHPIALLLCSYAQGTGVFVSQWGE